MNMTIIEEIKSKMVKDLSPNQLQQLESVLIDVFNIDKDNTKKDFINLFIFTKRSEGRAARTEEYYEQVLRNFEKSINNIRYASTEDIRSYLYDYQKIRKCSALTLDNMRRILSSFYKWLENEDYILKSPMRRISKIKIPKTIKSVYSDEEIVTMRESVANDARNLSIFDLLQSSGLRVGELVALNKNDLDLESQSAIVHGKGDKERRIYFDVKTKVSLKKYLDSRPDTNEALFVSKRKYTTKHGKQRISICQVERLIRKCGKLHNINAYPHKFRRTMATKAIDKGMPIEQVQVLLGHTKIDTTLKYAQVQQKNVRYSYLKYIC
ncbi:MAG: tyrosine-type recombinase/integrase [Treponema sp.]|nr:tyrosine-type recombinase/integrase [Treponema sp.]